MAIVGTREIKTWESRVTRNVTTGETACVYPGFNAPQDLAKRARRVHCLLGFPLDMVTMRDVLSEISEATRTRKRLFISTPNLNFVALATRDKDFRSSLRSSNLCLADGVAIKLIGKLLGISIPERVPGSDILNAIWKAPSKTGTPPLKVFFFGGAEEANQMACDTINQCLSQKIACVGNLYPGFGTIEEMSDNATLETINRSNSDFLIVALGARKGQAWIMHNKERLKIPIVSHLGATINFLAGAVQRAPMHWQRIGLEWLWRIKEEPALAKRYWNDGMSLAWLIVIRILPLSVWLQFKRVQHGETALSQEWTSCTNGDLRITLTGSLTAKNIGKLAEDLSAQLLAHTKVVIDCKALRWIDTAGMGGLMVILDALRASGVRLELLGLSSQLAWSLKANGLEELAIS